MVESAEAFHHGDQEVEQQIRTYHLFNTLTKWACLHIAVLVTILTLWFCVGVGFLGALVPGVIVFAVGVWFLRSKPVDEEI